MPANLLKSSPVDTSPPVEPLPPNIVEFKGDGWVEQFDIHSELQLLSKEDFDEINAGNAPAAGEGDARYLDQQQSTPCSQYSEVSTSSTTTTTGKTGRRGKTSNRSLKKLLNSQQQAGYKNGETPKSSRKSLKQQQPTEHLPIPVCQVLDDYKLSEAPPRPNGAYIRYIERTPEELADVVEYDLDEEDLAWLDLVNHSRLEEKLCSITPDWMEQIMDRLEKESFYMSSNIDQFPFIDDDAVCCICNDGECQNSNAILFCDMCNLAVHQECYGVPYIPEGQWLCRRCFFSPSTPVKCVLCPNSGGAFKQTECKRWAHVVCAIWIPEVHFANTVFLEPIDNILSIPAARWKLTCFICKQKNRGACIQCIKSNCYTAFHVTCGQQIGLCMKMESESDKCVKKKAWCPAHAPADFVAVREKDSSTEDQRLKKARKILADKRSAPAVVLVPTIAKEIIDQISGLFKFRKNDTFMNQVQAYWKLKRCSRNGVPLLRRLQNTNAAKSSRREDVLQGEINSQKQADTLRIRQDLEKGRLLCELTRKREKKKREWIYAACDEWDMKIQPFNHFLSSIIDDLVVKDSRCIFTQPVNPEVVPDYLGIIDNPMDLQTMRTKIFEFAYETVGDLQADFQLMIDNCLRYNSKGTVFYRAALRMQELGEIVFREAKRVCERIGFDAGGLLMDEPPPEYYTQPGANMNDVELSALIERVLEDKDRHDLNFDDHLSLLQDALDRSLNLLNPMSRGKKFNRVKKEIYKLRKKQRLDKDEEEGGAKDISSMDEDEPMSILAADMVESSEAGDDVSEHGAKKLNIIRRRLRSTDHQEQRSQPRHKAHKAVTPSPSGLSRRLSRSSESIGCELACNLITTPPSTASSAGVRSSLSFSPDITHTRARPGRPPKFLPSREHRARVSGTLKSKSPLRQSALKTALTSLARGGLRGRPSKLRRLKESPVRRSARVDNLQKQTQSDPHSKTCPEKELSGMTTQACPSDRSASPPKSSRSSRHVSPTQPSPLRSYPTRDGAHTSPVLGSPVRPPQVETRRPPREPSPILGSPLKPHQMHMLRKPLKRQNSPSKKSPPTVQETQRISAETSTIVTKLSRPRGRPRRNPSLTNNSNATTGISRIDSGGSKTMEAAAKSVVCDERQPRAGRQHHSVSANKTARRKILVDNQEDEQGLTSPTRLHGDGGATSRVGRRNSITKGSAILQNLRAARKSSIGDTSPARKLKGPASAVGKRKSSSTGASQSFSVGGRSETCGPERRKSPVGVQILNGISSSAMSPVRQPVSSPHRQLTTSNKKRSKRSAAANTAKSVHGSHGNATQQNNAVSGTGTGSLHHHHHHHSPRKTDSFSVYRNGGDHDINSYSEAESLNDDEDEAEEEEDDEDEDDEEEEEEDDDEDEEEEEGGNIRKPISASEDDENDDEDDNEDDDRDEEEDDEDVDRNNGDPMRNKTNSPSTCYQEEEEDDDDEEESDNEEEADDEEEDEDDDEESSSEDDVEIIDEEDDSESQTEEMEVERDTTLTEGVHQNELRSVKRSPGSDSNGSFVSVTYASRTGNSSSSSITTPQHQSPAPSAKRIIRHRRSSSKPGKPKPSDESKPATGVVPSSFVPLLQSQIAARVNQIVAPVTLNNNNVLCNNKEKDRDNASTSSSSGSSIDHVTTLNGSSHRRH